MSLVLHKIVGAIRVPENIISGVSKIEHYSMLATSKVLAVREIVHLDGIMKINGRATSLVATELAMGFTSTLRDVYKINTIPKSLELRAVEDVKLLPSYKVGENVRFNQETLKPEMMPKLDSEAQKIMSSTDLGVEITPKVVERNPVLKRLFDNLKGKHIKTIGGSILIFGATIAAVCVMVNEHRNRLTACMLYYYVKDQLSRCTIVTCTCKKVDCTKNCEYCTTEILQKYLPADMLVDNCKDFTGSAGCVNCPSDNYEKANINDDNTLINSSVANSSFVRCQRPDFFDALGDLYGGIGSDIMDIVRGSLNGLSWIIQKLPIIILVCIVGAIVFFVFSFIGKVSPHKDKEILISTASTSSAE